MTRVHAVTGAPGSGRTVAASANDLAGRIEAA
jgi:broad-specificity NMP kinase